MPKLILTHPALACLSVLAGMQLAAHGATLTNRYTFNEASGTNAVDSISGQNGMLMNTAAFTGSGQVSLGSSGLNSTDPSGAYVALPANLVTGYTAITIETWYTPTHNGAAFADWNRIWDFWNPTGHFFCRSGNNTFGIGGDITTTSSSQNIFGPTVPDMVESHVAWTTDPVSGITKLFINGVQVQSVTGFTNTPSMVGPTPNNWLGRAKFPDPYLVGSFNEFRVYSGALNPLEVSASHQSGPDTPSANFGTVTAIDLTASASLQVGSSQVGNVTASASGLTNSAININGQPGLTFSSSNPGVASVTTNGTITGVSAGNATITATYILNSVTNSDSVLISVVSVPAQLKHRYSFTNELSFDVIDSIGGANGTMVGAGIQSGGVATLDGSAGTYVNLPSNLVSTASINNGAVTFETWASFGVNANWCNLFAFGNTVGNDGGNYIFFSPHSGVADYRLVASAAMPGWSGGSEQGAFAPGNLDNQTNVHVVCVANFGRNIAAIYVNGVRVAMNTAFTRELSEIYNNFSYLGKSTYALDPTLNASLDEFRIYDGALSAQQIAASAQTSGPGSTNLNPGSFIGIALQAPTPLLRGWQSAGIAVIGTWQFATNVNLVGDLDLTYSSSNTNVATIDANGNITALSLGSTTITANYQGNISTQVVTIVNPPAAPLVHRYAFNETSGIVVNDLVGAAHGELAVTNITGLTNAAWTGSTLVINTNTGLRDAYVILPASTLSTLTSNVTIETWVTAHSGDYWTRIWDFGSAPGSPNFFLGRGGVFDWFGGSVPHGGFPNGVKTHIVVSYNDAQNQCKVYVNGVQTVICAPGAALTPVANVTGTNNWLGRSLYAADPFTQIEYDELRFYSGLLTSEQVAANFLAGPEPAAPPLQFTVTGANLNLIWPTSATGYVLKSTVLLGTGASWSTVAGTPSVVGTNNVLSVPMSGTSTYFRLEK
jgi:uncharacterized protein YjdB